jgi:quercetin dioxygenase-like cupin family protein
MARRLTPGQLGALIGVLVLGGVIGAVGDRLTNDAGPMRAAETAAHGGSGTLEELPAGPVEVSAESVRLPAGYESTHFHGGPTFNIVESGKVEILDSGRAHSYVSGDFFFEPEGRPHTIRVLETATITVIRLLPPGAEATTEVP